MAKQNTSHDRHVQREETLQIYWTERVDRFMQNELSSCNIISWHVTITRCYHNVKRKSVSASYPFDLEMKSQITFVLLSLCLLPIICVLVSTCFKVHDFHIYTLWLIRFYQPDVYL